LAIVEEEADETLFWLELIPTTILRFEAPTFFFDVKGKPDDFSLVST